MNKFFNIRYIVLVAFVSLASCIDRDLAEVGDLEDITGPTPFYTVTDVTTSEFDCEDVELWANYEFNFQAGSNLAVNGIYYDWTITPAEGVVLINKDVPILEQSIDAELASVVAIEDQIAKLEFKLPCETDAAKIAVMEAEIAALEIELAAAEAALTDETLQNVADLEAQIEALPAATLQDQELIFQFPNPGTYTVSLTVTDNLGKSDVVEKTLTVNQAVPSIAIPEIGEPGFEDGTLFDGSGDGRDSWRAPSSSAWGSVFQINTKTTVGTLPEGTQAAKFPADGTRTGYQEIEVTPGATYVLTYFGGFGSDIDNAYGDYTVGIISTNATTLEESKLAENIIATRSDSNVGRVKDVFKKHAITFEAGENESVIILLRNSGVETRLDAFEISVKL
ncbi:PKD domain-containing protein [Lutibacter holmesii]|uniref:PKD domain-containing protein n=1 Tax=Lutibacter holmesii TaxID=1137985 RepID=A0ABW3WPR7_9FLAO